MMVSSINHRLNIIFTLNVFSANYALLMLLKIKGVKHELINIAMK